MRRGEEAMIVVYRPGPEFLVLLRSPEDHGYWHLVAGGIEDGEEPEAAARRELAEETDLSRPVSFAAVPIDLGYRRSHSDFRVRVHPFVAEAPPGWEPTLNEEHVDYRWLPADEAMQLVAFPEPRHAVQTVARGLGEGR
jgi:8-oxo-dGTP pyrophosphatase MutT (NUDIX family)